jgi:phage replication-related protein YjqB (UPF0714/DUF867 family)
VTVSDIGAAVTALSFHGGGIEAGTSGISLALANRFNWNRYNFNAHGTSACLFGDRDTNSSKLHITAVNFNDHRAVALVGAYRKAVAIHGYSEDRNYDRGVMCVGGLDAAARSTFIAYISSHSSAWTPTL